MGAAKVYNNTTGGAAALDCITVGGVVGVNYSTVGRQ